VGPPRSATRCPGWSSLLGSAPFCDDDLPAGVEKLVAQDKELKQYQCPLVRLSLRLWKVY